jgi:hypothetical protein
MLILLCPILKSKSKGLDSVDVVQVDVKNKQVEIKTASNLLLILLLS